MVQTRDIKHRKWTPYSSDIFAFTHVLATLDQIRQFRNYADFVFCFFVKNPKYLA